MEPRSSIVLDAPSVPVRAIELCSAAAEATAAECEKPWPTDARRTMTGAAACCTPAGSDVWMEGGLRRWRISGDGVPSVGLLSEPNCRFSRCSSAFDSAPAARCS